MIKVFINGSEGTTGLKIFERFNGRNDIELLKIPTEYRKDEGYVADYINASDVTFLCLPDEASINAMKLIKNENVKIIDTSTAHRTNNDWAYGFPELDSSFLNAVKKGNKIAVPGCHASGFISIVYPLIKSGLISTTDLLTCFSLTGYSGGGKKMIASYNDENKSELLNAPRQYGLTQTHKHLKEMCYITGLQNAPIFSPIVSNYYCGMQVSVPLFSKNIKGATKQNVVDVLKEHYSNKKMVKVKCLEENNFSTFLPSNYLSNYDNLELYVSGNEDRLVVSALYDNLGKGASGAAVQCMNIAFGIDEATGLLVK